jgi:thioredoxin-related protein
MVLFVLLSGCLSAGSGNSTANNLTANNPEPGKITLQGLTFSTEVQPALEAAKLEGKHVFVYARSEDCGYCKKFEAETFTNQTVVNTLNENFILVSIDVYKQRSERINFKVYGTPTEIFLDSNGIEIMRIPGYTETQPFLDTVNQILK